MLPLMWLLILLLMLLLLLGSASAHNRTSWGVGVRVQTLVNVRPSVPA